jgi:hypothetical protein
MQFGISIFGPLQRRIGIGGAKLEQVRDSANMSGIAQAGLIFLGVFVLMILSARGSRAKPRIRHEDDETWWFARRSWLDDQH